MASVLLGVGVALCALLLLRWLALVALASLVVIALVRWARGLPVLPPRGWRQRVLTALRSAGPARPVTTTSPTHPEADACSWCGRPGGHLGRDGERIRPRHAHALR